MITPYASGGANILGARGAGFGGVQQASGGVQYFGAPSLAGDAPALLQISYVGPAPKGASQTGTVPYIAVSLLPDQHYQPLITAARLGTGNGFWSVVNQQTAVASSYLTCAVQDGAFLSFS